MQARSSLFIATFFLVLCTLGAGLAIFNFVVDPLQYYRVATLYRPVFWGGMQRFQNAGVARNYTNDIIVVGSSVTENFLTSFIEKEWGRKATRLSISGSTGHEQFLVLRLALRTGRITDVFWGLDAGAFYGSPTRVRDDQGGAFPHYLYRTNSVPNFEYLLSLGTTRLSLLALKGYGITDLDHYHTWFDKFEFSERATLESWRTLSHGDCEAFQQKFDPDTFVPNGAFYDTMEKSIDENLLSLIAQYPNVTFHLFFPPMARIAYIPARTQMLTALLPLRDAIARKTAGLSNVELFDFQSVDALTDDMSRYKDPIHFDLATSEYIIRAIHRGLHRVSAADLSSAREHLISKANEYDLCSKGRFPNISLNGLSARE
jgi:hypothetical protein